MFRYLLCLGLVGVFACGSVKAQPGSCATAAQCTDPADPFCVNSMCQATCSVNSDCTDPSAAICTAGGACVGCGTNADCTDPAAGICDTTSHACVACEVNADCTDPAAGLCDMTSHECRGCAADSECTGGVCIEAEGTCVADVDVAFVTSMGNDAGTCTRAAPCATLPFTLTAAGSRRVIHVLGGTMISNNVSLTGNRVIDGENTVISSGLQPAFTVTGTSTSTVTIEGVRLTEPTAAMTPTPAIAMTGTPIVVVYDVEITGNGGPAVTTSTSAVVTISHSHIGTLTSGGSSQIQCVNSTLTLDQNVFETSIVENGANNECDVTATRNKFDSTSDGSIQVTSGQVVMENNLIIHEMGFNDSILAVNLRAGSTIRFNTIVNTTAAPSDGAAISCDNSVEITSNIFAYSSGHPITGQGCNVRYSIFDTLSTTSAGTGNQVVDIDQIFANRAAGDYHLATTSVAKGGAEPGQETMVKIDFDGNPRPNPVGSVSDSGAFEAP